MKNNFKNWLYVDTRTLALFRIYFGFLGLFDVIRRYGVIDVFYSEAGMNFRRQVSGKYSIKYFSLLDHFHSTFEVQLFFIITSICFVFFILGYYTRFFQILSVLGLISIHNAAVILENGADMVINNYLIWSLFLPLGASLSIDSMRRSMKKYPEYDSNDLNKVIKKDNKPIFHFAYLACLVQLSMIYFYNSMHKTGDMWISDYTAIHYMYQLETFITSIGEFIREVLPISAIQFLTRMTMLIEFCAFFAILSPIFQPWLRRIVLLIFIPFHLIILLSVNIGLFSWAMFAALILLLSYKDIEVLKRFLAKYYKQKFIVFYDRDCGFCHLCARILKRMDIFSCLQWSDRLHEGNKPQKLESLLERSIVVWDPKSNLVWERHIAFSKILSSLPFGFLLSWILIIPVLEKIFGFIYDVVSSNRSLISKYMGLPVCGLKNETEMIKDSNENTTIIYKWKYVTFLFTNVIVLSLLVAAVDYSIQVNDYSSNTISKKEKKIINTHHTSFIQSLRFKAKRILLYPRMHQKWNMFSPKVLIYEPWVIADITFTNGEMLSLFINSNDVLNKYNREYFIPYNQQFWRKLFGRLSKASHNNSIPKFKKWLKETNYFSEYADREVLDVKLWKLSEKSIDADNLSVIPKVRKTELKKRDRNLKSRKDKKRNNSKVKIHKKKGYNRIKD